MKIILASTSPRRRDLFEQAGFDFSVFSVNVSETLDKNLNVEAQILDVTRRKLEATVCDVVNPNSGSADRFASLKKSEQFLIVTADTMVVHQGRALGKPENEMDAIQTLSQLSGHTHEVMTGVAVYHWPSQKIVSGLQKTQVRFRSLSQNEIKDYVTSGEPMDKAGSYAIQGEGKKFVSDISGPWDNVVGFPMDLFRQLLSDNGWV